MLAEPLKANRIAENDGFILTGNKEQATNKADENIVGAVSKLIKLYL